MNQPQVSLAKIKKVGKVIADLSDLPPKGRWIDHPCCCIVTTEKVIASHRPILKDFMKLIYIATENVNADKKKAAVLTSKWTKLPIEVEEDSLPTIRYMATFEQSWKKGMFVWKKIMTDLKQLKQDLKDKKDDEFWKILMDDTIMAEAEKEYEAEKKAREKK